MAQSGYTPISLYFTTTAAATPSAGNLVAGELALNTTDEKLYFKNAAGTVKLLASNAITTPVLTFQTSLNGLTPSTSTTGAITLAGTLGATSGGTSQTTYATGDILYASASNTLAKLTAGTNGFVLTLAAGIPSWAASTGGVTSFQTSLNGLTPSTSTTGAITLAGTLGATSGGTSQSTYATGDILYASASNTLSTLAAGTNGYVLTLAAGIPSWAAVVSAGTVTSVAQSFTGGIISVAGSPITTSGTLALTVAGTSGGIPYFGSASTWATSALLAANALMVGGGAATAPSTVTTGTDVVTALGVAVGSAGAFVVNGGVLGTPSSGTLTNATGLPLTTGVTGTLPIANGGTGTTTPAIVAGTNVTVSGTWPNQTINSTASGTGDVVGPSSATDTAITLFDGTTGKLVKNSLVTVSATGAIVAPQVGSTIPFYFADQVAFPSAATYHGALAHSHADGAMYFAHSSSWIRMLDAGTAVTIAQGGTGQTTANTAFNALAPSQISYSGRVLTTDGTNTSWAVSGGGGAALSNDTTTATNLYPIFAAATTGTPTTIYTGNTKLLYKPSTGEFQSTVLTASNGIFTNSNTIAADYTVAATVNGGSFGPVTIDSGITVTVTSGAVWTVV